MFTGKGVILWDIDGTLISTQRNANINLHQKVLEDCGFGIVKPDFETQGVSDWEIISRLLSKVKYIAKDHEIVEIIDKLDALSEESDKKSLFLPLPGVSNFLKNFASNFWIQGILTGNTCKITFAKLERASIANYFNHDYIFCCEFNEKRVDIARRAEKHIVSRHLETIAIIGDTPHDIAIAREIKAKAISVATGKFSQSDLAFFMPDLLIENLEFCSDKLSGFLKIAEVTIE